MPKWKALQESALLIVDCYRTVYRAEWQSCVTAIGELKHEIEHAYAFTRLEESHRQAVLATYFGPKSLLAISGGVSLESPGDLLRASERRKVSELQALRLGLPGYRHAILEHCDREWAAQDKQAGVANDADGQTRAQPRAKVFRLNMRERLSGKRFVTPEEFDIVWKTLGDEIVAKLKDGFEVVVD